MLNVQLLSNDAQLNDYSTISTVQYIPGESVTITFQFLGVENNLRFIPPTTATATISFKLNDGTMLVIPATMLFNPDDRSIWQAQITALQSPTIVGSNMLAALDVNGDGSNIQQALGQQILSPTYFEGDC